MMQVVRLREYNIEVAFEWVERESNGLADHLASEPMKQNLVAKWMSSGGNVHASNQ